MKKKIVSNTMIFILVVGFIALFSKIFGSDNTLVGVGVVTIALVLADRDLTIHPFKNTLKLLSITLGLGIFSFLAHTNIWLAIPLNFTALFFIGYVFSSNIRKSTVIPFGLSYLFMLYTPVESSELLTRLLSLSVGTLLVMVLQFILNKNRFYKLGIETTKEVYKDLLEKITWLRSEGDTSEIDKKIETEIKTVKKVILDKRVEGFYLTESADILTGVIWTFERISILLDEASENAKIEGIKKFLNSLYSRLKNIDKKDSLSISLSEEFKDQIDSRLLSEFDELLEDLSVDMRAVRDASERQVKRGNIDLDLGIPHHFKKLFHYKRDFSLKSLRFSFGLRLAVSVTLAAFLTQFFKLTEGRWMVYTVFSLIQPYSENCKTKAKERLQGTVIGTLIVLVSFAFIKGTGGRFAVILIAGYLNPYFKNYRDIAVTFTISAVASAALMGGTLKFVLARILFVILGTVIALFSNKFILPFKIEDGKKAVVGIYDYLVKQMIRDVEDIEHEQIHNHNIKGLFLVPSLIEDRMNLLNFGVNCKEESEFIKERREVINNIYKYYTSVRKDARREDIYEMISKLEETLDAKH